MTERCPWCGQDPLYAAYHDDEWGRPEWDSRALWEKLILDGFQAGLSWITILKKRDNFRQAFAGFDPETIASWGEDEVNALLQNTGIIRHGGKIRACITNAKAYIQIEKDEKFSNFLWKFLNHTPLQNRFATIAEVPAQTPLSVAMSKALKAKGFKFCGPTIVYAFMQATGMVNDHLITCPARATCTSLAGHRPVSG